MQMLLLKAHFDADKRNTYPRDESWQQFSPQVFFILHAYIADDERLTLGVLTAPIANVKDGQLGTKAPNVGVVVLAIEPSCDVDFMKMDIITHIDRKVVKSTADIRKRSPQPVWF